MTLRLAPSVRTAALFCTVMHAFAGVALGQDNRAGAGMAVSVITASRHCFRDTVPVSGFLEPRYEMPVRPERDGLVLSELLVRPGDAVTSNQILARLADPQTLQDEATVTAPLSGLILETSAVVGAYASPSASDPLFRILVNSELELKADVLPSDVAKLRVGQPVNLQLGDIAVSGKLRVVDTAVDGTTQLGVARISLAPDAKLRAGAFVRATIDAGETCGISVPLSAILYGRGSPLVETIRNGRVEIRSVKVGVIAGGEVEIRSGLRENDTVIARAGSFLREGDPVRAISAR